MNDADLRDQIHRAIDAQYASVTADPFRVQKVLHDAARPQGGCIKMKKWIALLLIAITLASTALAAGTLLGHGIELHEGTAVIDLLPDQWQTYDLCHPVSSGYLVGGFSLEWDVIAPMPENAAITLLDRQFQPQWTLRDDRLTGCLFDRVLEGKDALYLGTERKGDGWSPAIMKLGLDGEIAWLYSGDAAFRIKDFALGAGDVICAVGHMDGVPYLLTLDPDGRVLRQQTYPELPVDTFSAIHPVGDAMLLAGYAQNALWLARMDEGGRLSAQETAALDAPACAVRIQENEEGRLVVSAVLRTEDAISQRIQYFVIDP